MMYRRFIRAVIGCALAFMIVWLYKSAIVVINIIWNSFKLKCKKYNNVSYSIFDNTIKIGALVFYLMVCYLKRFKSELLEIHHSHNLYVRYHSKMRVKRVQSRLVFKIYLFFFRFKKFFNLSINKNHSLN